jgi:hypothetical protein
MKREEQEHQQDLQLRAELRRSREQLNGITRPQPASKKTPGRLASRYGSQRLVNPPLHMNLVRRANGFLEWDFGPSLRRATTGTRRLAGRLPAAGITEPGAEVIDQVVFEELEPNQVTKVIDKVDRWLTPLAWEDKVLRPEGLRGIVKEGNSFKLGPLHRGGKTALHGKKVFLFIHGTASNCDKNLAELSAHADGIELLSRLGRHVMLGFDHPTLGTTPLLNAVDLDRQLGLHAGNMPESIDIITHSRGGIVSRWFVEQFCPPGVPVRVVLLGCPISGTSLAAPANIKRLLDLFTNIAHAAGGAASFVPFLSFATALTEIMAAAFSFMAKTPAPDLLLNLLPGLAAQQRAGNNGELLRLRRPAGAGCEYHAVTANFEPPKIGWNFLKAFNKPGARVIDTMADYLFAGPNDLVVDTNSMTMLDDARAVRESRVLRFKGDIVHHCNYLSQPPTCRHIAKAFKLG